MRNKKSTDIQENNLDSPKLDPVFYQRMQEYYKQTAVKSTPESREKLLQLARDHKKKLAKEGKLNNSDWLKWTQPIITPIRDLRGLFTLDGFSISNLRVSGVLLLIATIIGGLSYLVYYQYHNNSKNTNPDNLISGQQTPEIKETPIPTPNPQIITMPTPNIVENNKPNNDNQLNTNIRNKDNRQAVITKNQQKINKGNNQVKQDKSIPQNNTIKNTDNNEPEQIAMLERERGQNATLATIKNIYISDLIDTDLRNALIELLQTNGFKVIKNLANEPFEASLEYSFSEKNLIALSVKNRQVWKKSLDSSPPKQEAQAIVISLLEAIEQAKKYLKNSK